MNINTGDKVKFLNDVGEGVISSIIDKTKVMVTTDDGFDMPVLINDLVITESAERPVQEIIQPEKEIIPSNDESELEEDSISVDEEIVFALNLKNNSDIFTYLINVSTYHLFYTVSEKKDGELLLKSSGKLEPDTKIGISKLSVLNMDEQINLVVNILFYGNSFYKAISPLSRKIEITPSDIYSGIILKENDYFDHNAAIFPLYSFKESKSEFTNTKVEGDLKKILEEKEGKKELVHSTKAKKSEDNTEVDLHIQEITDDYKNLTNGEIIEIQTARFKTSLDTAIIHKTRRVVFIHGVGNGKLKFELRKILDRDYSDLRYQDASFKEYGYGATMVIVPQ